jgi:hypothetical protein
MPVLLSATRGHRAGSTARVNWLESEKPRMAARSGSSRSSTPTRTATARLGQQRVPVPLRARAPAIGEIVGG